MGWRSLRLDLRLAHFVLESAVFLAASAYAESASSYQLVSYLLPVQGAAQFLFAARPIHRPLSNVRTSSSTGTT